MTDYRRTEQELWDEDLVADEDLTGPLRDSAPKGSLLESAAPSEGPSALSAPHAHGAPTVEEVADFIATSPRDRTHDERVGRARSTLELFEAEEGAEATEKRPHPLPPELPPDARPPELPSMMLGASISTRGDVTERVLAIPMTHPLANSIAPGGSRVSARPPATRSFRWQAALGGAALVLLGAGASQYLQSRGEHHAAGASAREQHEAREQRERREQAREERERRDSPPAVAPAAMSTTSEPTPTTAPMQVPPVLVEAPRARASQGATEPGAATPESERADQAESGDDLRVAMGPVQMRRGTRERATDAPSGTEAPQRLERQAVIAAMNAVSPQLRECVQGAHGIADVTLTVRPSGIVSHALVEGPFAGSQQGSCLARALRSVQLPRFRGASVRIAYPIEL